MFGVVGEILLPHFLCIMKKCKLQKLKAGLFYVPIRQYDPIHVYSHGHQYIVYPEIAIDNGPKTRRHPYPSISLPRRSP